MKISDNSRLELAGFTLLLSLAAGLTATALIKMLGGFIPDETFSRIFSQLATASVRAPLVLTILLALPLELMLSRFSRAIADTKRLGVKLASSICAGIAAIIGFVLLTLVTAVFSRVNGVLFFDVLVSLADVISKGGLF